MGAIKIELHTKDLIGRIERLQAGAPAAFVRALNRSIVSAQVEMARATADDLGLKVGDVRDQLRIINATPDKLTATITATTQRLPLIAFNARGPEPSRGKGQGVRVRLPGGAGQYPHAFIATMGSGHRGVFQRKGKGRLPVRELRGPSIQHVAVKHTAEALARGQDQLIKNLQSELRFAIRQAAA
jgi:hypothetical protein